MRAKRLSLIFQACFWVLIMVLQMVMATNFLDFRVALMFAGLNTILGMTAFYLNSLLLFPRFFEKRRYVLYVILNLLLLVVLSHIFFKVDVLIFNNFNNQPWPEDMPERSPDRHIFIYFRMFSMLFFTNFSTISISS